MSSRYECCYFKGKYYLKSLFLFTSQLEFSHFPFIHSVSDERYSNWHGVAVWLCVRVCSIFTTHTIDQFRCDCRNSHWPSHFLSIHQQQHILCTGVEWMFRVMWWFARPQAITLHESMIAIIFSWAPTPTVEMYAVIIIAGIKYTLQFCRRIIRVEFTAVIFCTFDLSIYK